MYFLFGRDRSLTNVTSRSWIIALLIVAYLFGDVVIIANGVLEVSSKLLLSQGNAWCVFDANMSVSLILYIFTQILTILFNLSSPPTACRLIRLPMAPLAWNTPA